MADTSKLSQKALDLILKFEVGGGQKYYDKHLASPSWPGGASGVTLGIGYDIGYEKNLREDFSKCLTYSQISRLERAQGLTGSRAKQAISGLRDIKIPWDCAVEVFNNVTIQKYIDETLKAFPKSQFLPDDAFGALVSLVFNRGAQVDDSPRRKEMAIIKRILALGNDDIVDKYDIKDISQAVRAMSRLWEDKDYSDNDLYDRRHQEADLILSTVQ